VVVFWFQGVLPDTESQHPVEAAVQDVVAVLFQGVSQIDSVHGVSSQKFIS